VPPADRICVVTGEQGSGKSTVCVRTARLAMARGFTVAGILTERVGSGDTSFRRVIDLSTQETRPFGSQDKGPGQGNERLRAWDKAASRLVGSDPLTPRWRYESEVFDWANEIFSRLSFHDLIVVDEVGPLELLGGRGWVKALDVLASAAFRLAVVVCRPSLLGELRKQLGGVPVTLFEVTSQTRESLPEAMLDRLSACHQQEDRDPRTDEAGSATIQ
jgi:nucleoside-triphosphatase THEP1